MNIADIARLTNYYLLLLLLQVKLLTECRTRRNAFRYGN